MKVKQNLTHQSFFIKKGAKRKKKQTPQSAKY